MLKSCKNSDVCKDFFNSERCQSGPDSPYWKEAQLIDTRNDTELADISKIANSTSQKAKETIIVDAMSSSVTLKEELIAAKKLYMQSKSAVVEMFNQARMGRAIAVEQADELVDNIRGSIARLSSGDIGVVVEQSPNSLLTPKVKIFYSPASNTYITPTLIDIGEPAQSEKIIERVLAQHYGFKNTETLWHGSPAQTK
ncbi:DUF3391 domain-containing protein [Pseudomonas fluorescens]|uniref:DUF3391 domain-containing protein n=1 Tax=Pseudomonas fluorescens TaxID=294 RepID=UPI001242E95A|nr:DUF3391 domain-containing protein [Pseudomonas fluorescens]VVN00999.1 hypothetical protein PS676_03277 [Pseudomonas fluorescens]